jgi:glucose/mannose transport system permease protein
VNYDPDGRVEATATGGSKPGGEPMGLIAATRTVFGDAGLREELDRLERKHAVASALALATGAFWLSPLWGGLTTAFKTQSAWLNTTPLAPPTRLGQVTIEPWIVAWETVGPGLGNSLIMTIPAMVFSGLLGSLAAYGLTMIDWRGQVALMTTFVCAVFMPKQAILLPLARFWSIIDLEGLLATIGYTSLPFYSSAHPNLLILIITHTCFGISICTLLFRGYYLSINQELIEAARIDGANIYGIYRKIVLPLSVPMFFVVFIFQFTSIYNEFLYALIIVGGSDPASGAPITLALAELNSGMAQNWNNQMAGAFITALPTLVVYMLFGKQFAEGVKY